MSQNSQQTVEKALKAALVERKGEFPRSHNIRELARLSADTEGFWGLSSEECDLLSAAGPGFQDAKIDLKSELEHAEYPPKTSSP
jgi:HEPN domain-containing protein